MEAEEKDIYLAPRLANVSYREVGLADFDEIFTLDADELLKKRYLSLND